MERRYNDGWRTRVGSDFLRDGTMRAIAEADPEAAAQIIKQSNMVGAIFMIGILVIIGVVTAVSLIQAPRKTNPPSKQERR
jgi:signal transduction histidine kinase